MNIPIPRPIYHVTHWQNLPSVFSAGALLSHHEMSRRGISYQNIAYDHIQNRRENKLVCCSKGGCLHDYVPFHFAPRSPMLYTISKGNVPGYAEGQSPLVYFVATAQAVVAAGLSFAFTDGHATMAITEFFDNLADLIQVDWDIMNGQYWFDSEQYPDRKRRRQAEFLVYQQFPVSLISEIGVLNDRVQAQVQQIVDKWNMNVPVQIRQNWYY